MFLDTSGLLGILDRRQPGHRDAVTLFTAAPKGVTHSGVVFELVALAESRGLLRHAALDFVDGLHTNPSIEVIHIEEQAYREGLDLLRSHDDKAWSLCDAVSFELMRDRHLFEALTTDHHFEQAGFIRLLTP